MKKRYSDEQIIGFLREADAGAECVNENETPVWSN